MLEVKGLKAGYGSIEVLRDLSFTVPKGKVVALLGGNGAGKTTTMNAIAGLMPNRGGQIRFRERDISRLPSHKIFASGISLVAQSRDLFPEMTVVQNLELGVLSLPGKIDIPGRIAGIFKMFPRLEERQSSRAAMLSGGEQQMLATGRALMAEPKLLLLDEPTTGLAPIIVTELQKIIRQVNAAGYTVLIVEQNTKMALDVADHICVLRRGSVVLDKPRSAVRNAQEIFDSYLH